MLYSITLTCINCVAVASDGLAKLWDCGSSKCLSDLISLNTTINSCSLGTSFEWHSPQTVGEQEFTQLFMVKILFHRI